MSAPNGTCWHCGQTLNELDFAREAVCPACAKPVHCCRNCRFFQPGRSNDCAEPVADHVSDKVRANFCDYFSPHVGAYAGPGADQGDLRDAAEALFKS